MTSGVMVIVISVLCVLGIVAIPEYIHLMEGAIVSAVQILVLFTIIGGFISVLWSNS